MEKTISELLGELEAKASPRPWWAHALTLSGPVKTIARFFGFDYAQGETDLAYTVLAANHLRPLVEALEKLLRPDQFDRFQATCQADDALAALHTDLEAALKDVRE
jgi:hypothetical protein